MKKITYVLLPIILSIGLTGCGSKGTTVTRISQYDGVKVVFTGSVDNQYATYEWKLRDYDFTEKGMEEIVKLNPKNGDRVKINTIGSLILKLTILN